MRIEPNRAGIIAYRIHINNQHGELLEEASVQSPRTMLFGTGRLMKSFEEKLSGLRSGDQFEFVIPAAEAFGDYKEEMLMELPLTAFMVNGELRQGTLEVGRTVPMMDSEGNPFDGRVIEIRESSVMMDFNHPLAGKSLFTTGEIINVREATYEELNPKVGGCGCGTPDDACCGSSNGHHHHDHDHHHAEDESCGVCGDGNGHYHGGCGC